MQGVGSDLGFALEQATADDNRRQATAAVLDFVTALHQNAVASSTSSQPRPVPAYQPVTMLLERHEVDADRELQPHHNGEPAVRLDHESRTVST